MERLADWMEETAPILEASDWGPALTVAGYRVLEILRVPLHLELLAHHRRQGDKDDISRGAKSPSGGRLKTPAFLVQRRLPGPLLEYRARWKSATLSSSPVVFWPREPTHVKVQAPVYEELLHRGVAARMVACRPAIFASLHRRGYRAIFTRAAWKRAAADARRAARAARVIFDADPGLPPSFPGPRLGSADPCASLRLVREVVVHNLELVHESLAVAAALIESLDPRILVVGNDVSPEGRVGCLVARRCGVRTASLMHGAISGNPMHGFHTADRLLLYGERGREQLLALGVSPRKLIVCGAPNLDAQTSQTGRMDPAVAEYLGIPPDQPWVLVATSGPGHGTSHRHHRIMIQILGRLAACRQDLHFVAKLHRKDRAESWHQALDAAPGGRFRVVAAADRRAPSDIFDWLQGCPAMMTISSMAAVEAMLMEVPVISMDFCEASAAVDFVEAGATHHVRSAEELEEALNRLLPRPGAERTPEAAVALRSTAACARRFAASTFHSFDASASSRAAEAICRAGEVSVSREDLGPPGGLERR